MPTLFLKPLITQEQQSKGFQFCCQPKFLNQGLLFIYDCEKDMAFHMNNVSFDIDIIFLNENKIVVDFFTMHSGSGKTYKPHCKCKYAIELPKGVLQKFKIQKNKRLNF